MNNEKNSQNQTTGTNTSLPKCGIVMPISPIDGCTAEHWSEVLSILRDVITNAGFEPNLVSDADDIGIIQKRIIQNLYSNEVVVCDVSCKNPNVMFELGIRLAFDKPTIIIKDELTDYTFDTSIIEHLSYPRDLRFTKILSFKENLKKKIQATYSKSQSDANYSTFLKNFGEYKIASLSSSEISTDKFILSSLEDLKNEIFQIKRNQIIQNDVIIDRSLQNAARIRRVNQPTKDAKEVVSKYIDEYLNSNRLKGEDIWLDELKTSELIKFLESKSEVRASCGNSKVLTEITNDYLMPF